MAYNLNHLTFLEGHRFDPDTPIEEMVPFYIVLVIGDHGGLCLNSSQMQALHDVVKAGYARYIGMSSCWAWQCM
jgi:aryl-alcohol dehydrogenase-like predicted oxidoreductase